MSNDLTRRQAMPPTIERDLLAAHDYALFDKADNTIRGYRHDFRLFKEWCDERGLAALPAELGTIAAYFAYCADSGLTAATIVRRRAGIAYAHETANVACHTHDKAIKRLMSGIRRRLGSAVEKKAPATAVVISQMLDMVPRTVRGARDRAILLLGFAGAFRRSELAAIRVEDIERTNEGIVIRLPRSKTDQEGKGRYVPIPRGNHLKPVAALDEWLKLSGIKTGPVFRRIYKCNTAIGAEPLSPNGVVEVVKEYARRAGLDPKLFAGHSLRAGFVTSALSAGASQFRIMDQTGHVSVATLREYDRRDKFFKGHAGDDFL